MLHHPASWTHESLFDRSTHQDSKVCIGMASPKARPPVGSGSTVLRSSATSSGSARVALWPRRRGRANIQSWMNTPCCCSRKISKRVLGPPIIRGASSSMRSAELGWARRRSVGLSRGASLTVEKRSAGASERDEWLGLAWRSAIDTLGHSRLVFVDETGTHTSLAPLYAYSPGGQRAFFEVPRSKGANTTLLASVSLEGMGPSMVSRELRQRKYLRPT